LNYKWWCQQKVLKYEVPGVKRTKKALLLVEQDPIIY
jgi:hypothetical protein